MKILVTGASGFVGRPLCASLVRQGHFVRKAVRSPAAVAKVERNEKVGDLPDCDQVAVGNIGPETEWGTALTGIDVVIHLAARVHVMNEGADDPLAEFRQVNVLGTERLARSAVASGVKRLVYVSSIKVNGEATSRDQKFTESDMAAPQDPYGISKWEAERILCQIAAETGLEVVIVRPPLVYGPGVKGNFAKMLKVLDKGIPLPLASVRNLRSLVYVGNLADALIACASHPAAAGQTYLVCDGEAVSTPDLLLQLAAGMGVPSHLFPCPPVLLRFAGKLTGKSQQLERLLGSLQVDGDKMRTDLNWVPPYSLKQGLRATAEWYRTKHT